MRNMRFLEHYWDSIQQPQKEMGMPAGACGSGFWRPWVSDLSNILMILRALEIKQPRLVVETGTYEGLTTFEMMRVMSAYSVSGGFQSQLYTFDAGGPVSCYGDGKSVVVNWQSDPAWAGWDRLVVERNRRLTTPMPNLSVEYIEGLTADTLPAAAPKMAGWDFWYQDSVHGTDLIIGEWKVMEPLSKVGSVVAFDDILATHPFKEWFPANNPGWQVRWADKDTRSQLWAERIN